MKYRFGADLARAVRIRGLTAQRVAELASVSPATVGAALHGKDVQMSSALRIARAVTQASVLPELEQWEAALESE